MLCRRLTEEEHHGCLALKAAQSNAATVRALEHAVVLCAVAHLVADLELRLRGTWHMHLMSGRCVVAVPGFQTRPEGRDLWFSSHSAPTHLTAAEWPWHCLHGSSVLSSVEASCGGQKLKGLGEPPQGRCTPLSRTPHDFGKFQKA